MARRRALSIAAPAQASNGLVGRLLRSALILLALVVVVLGAASGFLTYRIMAVHTEVETVSPLSSFQSSYINLSFTDGAGGEHDGWLLVGLKGAPVIVLAHGYNSNRAELLALGNLLQQNHFNVYIYNYHGPKARSRFTDLGIRQTDDLLAAINKVSHQKGVNPHRVGLFGINTGGYAALRAAEQNTIVKALVVDSVYDTPQQMMEAQVDELLGGSSSQFRTLPTAVFGALTWGKNKTPVHEQITKLEGVPKLFIQGRDSVSLARETEELYNRSPQPKRMLVLEHSYTSLASGAIKKEYEDQVLTFFLQNLPLRAD